MGVRLNQLILLVLLPKLEFQAFLPENGTCVLTGRLRLEPPIPKGVLSTSDNPVYGAPTLALLDVV